MPEYKNNLKTNMNYRKNVSLVITNPNKIRMYVCDNKQ